MKTTIDKRKITKTHNLIVSVGKGTIQNPQLSITLIRNLSDNTNIVLTRTIPAKV